MRTVSSLLAIAFLAALFCFTPASAPVKAAAQPDDNANATARQFAPWLRAFVRGKQQNADQLFRLRPSAQNDLTTPEASAVLARLAQSNSFDMNLVWFKSLGENMGIVFFTLATEDGPVGIKIYYYGFNNQMYISKVDLSDHWSEIEHMTFIIDPMSAPLTTVPLNDN